MRREVIGQPECPLMHRWTLAGGRAGKLLVHHFLPTQRDRDPHDHPRAFLTFVVRGGYDDVSVCVSCKGTRFPDEPPCGPCGATGEVVDRVRAPALRLRRAEHAHVTIAGPRGAWTVVVMGPLRRDWGLFRDGRWLGFRAYERLFGDAFRCGDEQ